MFRYLLTIVFSLGLTGMVLLAATPTSAAIKCGNGFKMDANNVTCIPDSGPNTGLAGAKTYLEVLQMVLQILLGFAGAVSVLAIVYGGVQYITSGGNEETAKKARANLQYAIIGVVITIMAYTIIRVLISTVT
jgi:hypothetical protein